MNEAQDRQWGTQSPALADFAQLKCHFNAMDTGQAMVRGPNEVLPGRSVEVLAIVDLAKECGRHLPGAETQPLEPVSYTHLTLPTIYSV